MPEYTWATRVKAGEPYYEVSSKGDKRFSAFNARLRLRNYASIEYLYQVVIKGYETMQEGKGKPPLFDEDPEVTYAKYKALWAQFLDENPKLEIELRENAKGKPLTDMFSAKSPINQARALADLLNERPENPKFKPNWMTGFTTAAPSARIYPDWKVQSKKLPPNTRDT